MKAPAAKASSKVVVKKPVKKAAAKKLTSPTNHKHSTTQASASSIKLQRIIAAALDDNKAEDIVAIDLIGKSSFADAMLVASGRSARHVVALSEHVAHAMRDAGFVTPSIEGRETGDWVLLDAGDIIVHLFRPEIRQFYNLEKMWSVPAVSETIA